jgi:hypothetical protein
MKKVLVGLGAVALAWAPMAIANAQGGGGAHPSVLLPCNVTYSKGSGAVGFTYCMTTGGNVHSFAFGGNPDLFTPGNDLEGYGVCHDATFYEDYSDYNNTTGGIGWNAGVTTGTAANLTVSRTSTDGLVKLVQNFTPISTGGVKIKMTVTNLSSVTTLTNLKVMRVGDIDAPGGGNFGLSTLDSATVTGSIGATLTDQTYATPHTANIGTFPTFGSPGQLNGCTLSSIVASPATGDLVVTGTYTIGNLKPGKGKTVTFAYTRV